MAKALEVGTEIHKLITGYKDADLIKNVVTGRVIVIEPDKELPYDHDIYKVSSVVAPELRPWVSKLLDNALSEAAMNLVGIVTTRSWRGEDRNTVREMSRGIRAIAHTNNRVRAGKVTPQYIG